MAAASARERLQGGLVPIHAGYGWLL